MKKETNVKVEIDCEKRRPQWSAEAVGRVPARGKGILQSQEESVLWNIEAGTTYNSQERHSALCLLSRA